MNKAKEQQMDRDFSSKNRGLLRAVVLGALGMLAFYAALVAAIWNW